VIVVERNGKVDAILVGRKDKGSLNLRLGYLQLNPRADILYFVYGALRGVPSPENGELLIGEICRSLSHGEADVAYLNFLRTDSPMYRLAISKPGFLSRDRMSVAQPHFTVAVPGSIDAFYRSLSPKFRWQTKNRQRKLAADFEGAVRIRCFREVTEVDAMMQDAEQIASRTYQRGLGVGFVGSPEIRGRLALGAQKGWLRGYVLYVADRPCAFWTGILEQDVFTSEYLGFDPDLGKYSPGTYLITKVIEQFCESKSERVKEIDFASGTAQYKETLGNCAWHEAAVYIFAPSLRGMRLNFIRSLNGLLDHSVKNALGRTRLLQAIKKRWRSRARRQLGGVSALEG
jgi:CelD/BcsL family acetyltransferase involved in cellulose biosynthesis